MVVTKIDGKSKRVQSNDERRGVKVAKAVGSSQFAVGNLQLAVPITPGSLLQFRRLNCQLRTANCKQLTNSLLSPIKNF
jgi:hypothetical protein